MYLPKDAPLSKPHQRHHHAARRRPLVASLILKNTRVGDVLAGKFAFLAVVLLRNAPLVDLRKDTLENNLPHGRDAHHGH